MSLGIPWLRQFQLLAHRDCGTDALAPPRGLGNPKVCVAEQLGWGAVRVLDHGNATDDSLTGRST